MAYIKTIKDYLSKQENAKQVLLICGFQGRIWHFKRLINVLLKDGYNVRAVDYTSDVLTKGDPQILIDLIHEVHEEATLLKKSVKQPVLLIGASLGALIALNILRRDKQFSQGVMLTGGDVAKAAQRLNPNVWPQTYKELATIWQSVNMYTDPKSITHATWFIVLPTKDKLIDPEDIRKELAIQNAAGNKMQVIERNVFGHLGTVLEEIVLFPKRTLKYIEKVK